MREDNKRISSTVILFRFVSVVFNEVAYLTFESIFDKDLKDSIIFIFLLFEKDPVFPFLMLSAKQGNYWYLLYNVFGMTRSLTGD